MSDAIAILESLKERIHDDIEIFTNHYLEHHAEGEDEQRIVRDFADAILENIHGIEPAEGGAWHDTGKV